MATPSAASRPSAIADLSGLVKALDDAGTAVALVDAVRDVAAAELPAAIHYLSDALKFNNPGAAVAAVEAATRT